MKFGQPLLTTEASGALGGIVGSRARGGVNYFRVRRVPSNPRTYLQSVVRAILSGVAAAWRNTLTSVQRAAWTSIAKTGESGIDRYTASNTQLMIGGNARLDVAPTSPDLAWLSIPLTTQFVADNTPGTNIYGHVGLNVAGTTFGANGEFINFYVQSESQPPSRQFPVGNMAYAGTFTIAGTTLPTVPISAFTHPNLASLADAAHIFVDVVKVRATGEVSQRVTNLTTVT